MATLSEIKEWFRTGLKPTQIQFWATWDSFWHKDTPIPQSAIENLENTLINKADTASLEGHINDPDAHGGGGGSDLQSTLNAGSEAVLEEGTYNVKIGEDIGFGNFNGTEYLQDRNEFKGSSAYKVNTDNGTFRQEGYVDIYSESSYTHAYLTSKFYKPDSGMYLCSELDLFSTNTGEAAGFSLTLRDETSDWSGLHYQTTDALGRSGIIVKDNYHSKGLEYFLDYSANYTDRSLVDKAYVDSVAGGGGTTGMDQLLNFDPQGTLLTNNIDNRYISINTQNTDTGKISNFSISPTNIGISGDGGVGITGGSGTNISLSNGDINVSTNSGNTQIIGGDGVRISSSAADIMMGSGNISLTSSNIAQANGSNLVTAITNGVSTVNADTVGRVDISSLLSGGSASNLQNVLDSGYTATLVTTSSAPKQFSIMGHNTDTGTPPTYLQVDGTTGKISKGSSEVKANATLAQVGNSGSYYKTENGVNTMYAQGNTITQTGGSTTIASGGSMTLTGSSIFNASFPNFFAHSSLFGSNISGTAFNVTPNGGIWSSAGNYINLDGSNSAMTLSSSGKSIRMEAAGMILTAPGCEIDMFGGDLRLSSSGVTRLSGVGNLTMNYNDVPEVNGHNMITSVTNGTSTVYADSDGVVDISSISGGGGNNGIPTLQQVVEAGAEGIAPFIDGEVGLRLGQSNSDGELQGIVCYPSNVNLQSTYVNLLATESLYAEARTGYTLTTFGGNITFNVPAGKFIVNENSVLTGNYGSITINPSTGNTFTIPHNFYNLYGNPVPSYVSVRFSKYSPDLMYYTTTVDETNITITFPTVPTETSLDIYWEVRP